MNKNLLHKFFSAKTTIEEEKEIRKWLNESPQNKAQMIAERKFFDLLLFNNPPRSFRHRSYRRSYVIPTPLKTAAVILLILGLSYRTIYYHQKLSDIEDAVQTINVPAAQRVQIILPDKTKVWLNAKTTFKYSSIPGRKKREVYLDGEAYFEVEKNKHKPFIVHTAAGDVVATGTTFNVEAYSDKEKFETALMEGSITLETNNTEKKQQLKLQPQQKVSLKNGKLLLEKIEDFDPYLWRRGLIAFKNKTLKEILQQFEKYYDIKIKVSEDIVEKHTLSGKFRQSDGIDYALKVLQKNIDFDYERDDKNNIIYIKPNQ